MLPAAAPHKCTWRPWHAASGPFSARRAVRRSLPWSDSESAVPAAAGVGVLYFKAAGKLNLRRFFQVTAILLILMASGLGAHGVHELQEAGVIPAVKEHVFDINPTIRYAPGPAVESSVERLMEVRRELGAKMGQNGEFSSKRFKPYREATEAGFLSVKNPIALAFSKSQTAV